jgi:hypothetical protein
MARDIALHIKGDVFQARAALDARGLLTTTALDMRERTTIATVHPTDLEVVARWFCESGKLVPGFGYEVGTLLFYI